MKKNFYICLLSIILTFIVLLALDFLGDKNPIRKVAQELNDFKKFEILIEI